MIEEVVLEEEETEVVGLEVVDDVGCGSV